jgi:hypothetical protein
MLTVLLTFLLWVAAGVAEPERAEVQMVVAAALAAC